MDILTEARLVLQTECQAIERTADLLDQGFVDAIAVLEACRGKVVVSGLGKSGLVGRKIASTLASTGMPASFLHPAEGIHGELGMFARGDVALLISKSGETEEMLKLVPVLKRIDVPIVSICGRRESPLARHATVNIPVSIDGEAGPLDMVPTASTTATLAVGDALAVVLLKKRGFSAEDFAVLHPGGTIGKKLLLRVDDLMHGGEDNALVAEGTSMKRAIVVITQKGLGSVCVVDASGQLSGILTDGDLRRSLERFGGDLLVRTVDEVMTRKPITIASGRLAVEAVRLMEDRPSQIAVLPVVDDQGRPLGLLRLHDLVLAGVT